VSREKRELDQRLQERNVIEQELKNECAKLASALAACQLAHEAALQRAQEAAVAHEREAVTSACSSAFQEGRNAAEQSAQQQLDSSKARLSLPPHNLPRPV
jgi:septal ring factor EnvC (AmiA/AmiB activator)